MFETVIIENFRSIFKAEVNLTPLTVIVGANGSGKSNLIKALEFLGTVPRVGLAAAVNWSGGFQALVPKAVSTEDLKKTRIRFQYRVLLRPLEGYSDRDGNKLPRLAVEHDLKLAYATRESVRVIGERLVYHQPLVVATAFRSDRDEKKINKAVLTQPSMFVLERGPKGAISYSSDPPFAKAIPEYLEWLGLAFTQESVTSASALKKVLKSVETRETELHPVRKAEQNYQSLLNPEVPTGIDLAPQARVFLAMLKAVRRYDLLLSELRPEQQVSEAGELSTIGNNMPSVLSHIQSTSKGSWNRILRTLGAIAPHIVSMRSNALRTGKEFVEFIENAAKRGVESWESSDGTLRALAILLALETHSPYSTILIEEPEQNLHPWAVREIVEHIREVIKERHVQVILATHSQQVLEKVYPDEVRVVTRTEQEGTKFRTLEEILPDSEIIMGEVAQLWVKGLLGGVPSDEC